jgi:hypothetical protein
MATMMPIITMTTISSVSVKARRESLRSALCGVAAIEVLLPVLLVVLLTLRVGNSKHLSSLTRSVRSTLSYLIFPDISNIGI